VLGNDTANHDDAPTSLLFAPGRFVATKLMRPLTSRPCGTATVRYAVNERGRLTIVLSQRRGLLLKRSGRRGDMYMMREVFQAQRGKASEIVAGFKALDMAFEEAGYKNRRIYVDCTGPMDTVVYQWEVDSIDQYFTMERGYFVNPDADTQALIDALNSNAKSGYKEIYEVVQ
jgi:hypothetical protein